MERVAAAEKTRERLRALLDGPAVRKDLDAEYEATITPSNRPSQPRFSSKSAPSPEHRAEGPETPTELSHGMVYVQTVIE
jgi:hypothetical protein